MPFTIPPYYVTYHAGTFLKRSRDLPPINQVGCSVRIPTDGRRGHGTQTVSGRGDHRASADDRK